MTRTLLTFVRWLVLAIGLAGLALPARAETEFLPPAAAYQPQVSIADGQLLVRYEVAPGYYLYRSKLGFESATPGVTVGALEFPVGIDHEDEYFGKQVIYRDTFAVAMPVSFDGPPRDFELKLKLQGCADAGLCYPPLTWTRTVAAAGAAIAPVATGPAAAPAASPDQGFSLRKLLGGGPKTEGGFLPMDQAFVFSAASSSPDRVTLRWEVADGYYLYRDKLKVVAVDGAATLGAPQLPAGKLHVDEYFGEQVVYYEELVANVPVSAPAGTRRLALDVSYMGCADAGLCYPPTTRRIDVELGAAPPMAAAADAVPQPIVQSEQDALAARIRSGNLLAVLATFFGAGLLLAFTPCVLPMVPILSGIIVGAGRDRPVSRGRAFSLSLAYVMGMALTYTIAGAVFAAAGQQAQAFFQKPWIIVLFAGLFVVLALAMFGVFTLQVPAALQARLADASNKQRQGTGRHRGDGRAVVADRHGLRGAAAGRRTCRHRPERRRVPRRRRAVRAQLRHGRAAAGGGRVRRAAAAESRAVDGRDQGRVRRDAAGGRGVDARPHPAGTGHAGAVGIARLHLGLLLVDHGQ